MKSTVWTSIDFNAFGVQSDFIRVPHSSNTSAYGWIPVPMLCLKGGDGPTALLTAGTHGDEYEGQVALRKLVHDLAATQLQGRVIILPALNQPAVAAGCRNSPLDGGNLNRLFPGSAESGPTAAIAHYVATELFPLSDLVIDLHSGGSSLEYLPMSLARHGRTKGEAQAIRDLITCFGAPYGMITDGSGGGAGSTLYAAAEQQGIPALTAELGGGPTLSEYGLSIAENGIRRVLGQYGIASGLDCADSDQTLLCRPVGTAGNLYAPLPGLFEPFVKVGERVVPGQRAGRLHRLDDALGNPVDLSFSAGGVVCFRRFLTLTSTGDALFGLMTELET